jgi:hypothetical protein
MDISRKPLPAATCLRTAPFGRFGPPIPNHFDASLPRSAEVVAIAAARAPSQSAGRASMGSKIDQLSQ